MDYLPLRVTKNLEDSLRQWHPEGYKWGNGFEMQKEMLQKTIKVTLKDTLNAADIPSTKSEYLKAILAPDFLKEAQPKYEKFSQLCANLTPTVMQMAGYSLQFLMAHPDIDIRTELRDLLVQTILIDEWAMNKQVLKPDGTFAYHLIQTEKLRIYKKMLDHLPFNHFYVDLSDKTEEDIFGDVKGVFVNVIKIDDIHYSLALYLTIEQEAMTFSYYNTLTFNDPESEIEIDTTEFRDEELAHIIPQETKLVNNTKIMLKSRNIKVFILQLLCYISIPDADVSVSPQTKQTYHPNKVVKNKFREVYVQDVGIRIGDTINKKKKEAIREYEQSEEYQRQNPKTRKSPVAHFRRAHWHRFRTGFGRRNIITKWVEPTFVCGASKDVIIHPVK